MTEGVKFPIFVEVDPSKAKQGTDQVSRSLQDLNEKADSFGKNMRHALEAIGAFEAGKKFLEIAEASDKVDEKLRLVTKDEEDLIATRERLKDIANEGGVSLVSEADAYQKLILSTQELGKTSAEVQNFLRNLNVSVRASGSSAEEAQGAIQALAFSMSTGTLQGRALRSILNEIPTVADALAKKLGVTRSGLKELGDEGKISSEDLFQSLSKLSPEIEKIAEKNGGLGHAVNELKNNFTDFIGGVDKSFGVIENLNKSLGLLSKVFKELDQETIQAATHLERYIEKTQKAADVGPALGAEITILSRELKGLEGRQVISDSALARIAELHDRLDRLRGVAREVTKAAEPKAEEKAAVGGPSGGEGASQAQNTTRLLNGADERRIDTLEKLKQKLDDRDKAAQLVLTSDRASLEVSKLISAAQEKGKKKQEEINDEDREALILKAKKVQADEDQAKAYQDIVGPQEQYRQTEEALIALEKKHPELLDKIGQKLDENRLKYLENAHDLGSGFERAFLKMKLESQDFATVAENSVNAFADRATDALTNFVQKGKFDFAGFADAIIQDLERILVRALVVAAITALVPGLGPALSVGGAVAGAHAGGGTEQPGRSYIVGENGPEVHTPGQTGSTAPIGAAAPPPVNVQVVNVQHPDEIPNAIASGASDRAILNVLSRNQNKVRRIVGQ